MGGDPAARREAVVARVEQVEAAVVSKAAVDFQVAEAFVAAAADVS